MVKIRDRVETINFGWAEAVTDRYDEEGNNSAGGWVDVKFDSTGNVRNRVRCIYFKQGAVRDGSIDIKFEVGQIWNTVQDGKVKILKIIDSVYSEIEFFNTGNIYKCQKDALLRGFVKDRPAEVVSVEKRKAILLKRSEEHTAHLKLSKEIKEAHSILVKANKEDRERRLEALKVESHERWLEYKEAELIRTERNKELLVSALDVVERDTDEYVATKGVLDIDFKDRNGDWVLRYRNPKTNEFVQTRLGKIHNNFTQRSNKRGSVQNVYGKSYLGTTCSDLFSDAQKFAAWAVIQYGWNLGYHLEKDLLVEGNREYGEDTCCFLPQCINQAIKSKSSGTVVKQGEFFSSFVSLDGERLSLGRFESKEEAEDAALHFKRKRLYKLAQEYKETIDPRAYDRLINF